MYLQYSTCEYRLCTWRVSVSILWHYTEQLLGFILTDFLQSWDVTAILLFLCCIETTSAWQVQAGSQYDTAGGSANIIHERWEQCRRKNFSLVKFYSLRQKFQTIWLVECWLTLARYNAWVQFESTPASPHGQCLRCYAILVLAS